MRSPLAICLLGSAVALTAAAPATATPPKSPAEVLADSVAVRHKARGGLPLWFMPRPSIEPGQARLPAASEAPVLIRFTAPPTGSDFATLEALGVALARGRNGSPRVVGNNVLAQVSVSEIIAVAALPTVTRIHLDGSPFGVLAPMDVTAAEIEAPDVWQTTTTDGLAVDGTGITVCDSDSGVDIFHPSFFRADGGYFEWRDTNKNGLFEPDMDGVVLDGAGTVAALSVLNSLITSYHDDVPMFGSESPAYQLGLDWLYVDLNGNGTRDFGPEAGFGDSDPSFGEPIFVADDVDGDHLLDVGEKVVALSSSKIAAVHFADMVYRRDDNLSAMPRDEGIGHGTSSAAVMVGGQRGLSRKVGIAPGADLIMANRYQSSGLTMLTHFCINEGATVMLHEYAAWFGYHLDGSDPLEQLIDESSAEGMAHINPAGNLSGAQKLYKRLHAAGQMTTIDMLADSESPYAPYHLFGATILWRDVDRDLSVELEDPTAFTKQLPTTEEMMWEEWHSGLWIYAERDDSNRGTAKLDIYIYDPDNEATTIDHGTWKLHVTDPAPPNELEMGVFAWATDDTSGWGMGIHFPDHWSEDHLIGWPGTSDTGNVIAAYTGTGLYGGVPGEREHYSGRGFRIDGEEIMSVSAPADPIVAGYAVDDEARYSVFAGTSGSSPHAAGAAALLLQAEPEWTGEQVRQAMRDGALADSNVGTIPNHDWGYGKLRIHRSLYGEDPPAGTAPQIVGPKADLTAGVLELINVTVSDAEDPVSALDIEIDHDYDGVYDEHLIGTSFEASFSQAGTYYSKLRVTDTTGRTATALAQLVVSGSTVEPPPDEPPSISAADVLLPGRAGLCFCSAPGGRHGGWSPWAAALALVVVGKLRRRRR